MFNICPRDFLSSSKAARHTLKVPFVSISTAVPKPFEERVVVIEARIDFLDGAKDAALYLGSPATVAASAIAGRITDPRTVSASQIQIRNTEAA